MCTLSIGATLTIRAAACNPNGRGSWARPGWGMQEVSSGFAFVARTAHSQLALRTRTARSRLACARSFYFDTAKNIWIHTKNIWIHTLYEFIFVWIRTFKVHKIHEFILNSLYIWIHMLYEFIHSTELEIKNFPGNRTIHHNTCATNTPPHCLDKPIFF